MIRGDIKLLATPNLRLQYGDRLTIVGEHEALNRVERFVGNAVKTLSEPNLGAIFLGIILGLALGTIPIYLPGMSAPVRLGIAGGPIVMGIIMGALCPRLHIISYTTRSASLMLRQMGFIAIPGLFGLRCRRRVPQYGNETRGIALAFAWSYINNGTDINYRGNCFKTQEVRFWFGMRYHLWRNG